MNEQFLNLFDLDFYNKTWVKVWEYMFKEKYPLILKIDSKGCKVCGKDRPLHDFNGWIMPGVQIPNFATCLKCRNDLIAQQGILNQETDQLNFAVFKQVRNEIVQLTIKATNEAIIGNENLSLIKDFVSYAKLMTRGGTIN